MSWCIAQLSCVGQTGTAESPTVLLGNALLVEAESVH